MLYEYGFLFKEVLESEIRLFLACLLVVVHSYVLYN